MKLYFYTLNWDLDLLDFNLFINQFQIELEVEYLVCMYIHFSPSLNMSL